MDNGQLFLILFLIYPAWRFFLWRKDPCHYWDIYTGGHSPMYNPGGYHNFHIFQLEDRVKYICKNDPAFRFNNNTDLENYSKNLAYRLYNSNTFSHKAYGHVRALNVYLCKKMRWEIVTVADLYKLMEQGPNK